MICENEKCCLHVLEREQAGGLSSFVTGVLVGCIMGAQGELRSLCLACMQRHVVPWLRKNGIESYQMTQAERDALVASGRSHIEHIDPNPPKGSLS